MLESSQCNQSHIDNNFEKYRNSSVLIDFVAQKTLILFTNFLALYKLLTARQLDMPVYPCKILYFQIDYCTGIYLYIFPNFSIL